MATSSANDIMKRAMVKAKIISPGEFVQAGVLSQVFDDLNDMLESWSLENLMVYARVLESFSFVVGQAEYTFGDGGDFDSDRPVRVLDECFVRDGSTDFPIPKKTMKVYRARATKETGARPRFFAINCEYPLTKLFFWPVPSSAYEFHVSSWKQLVEFSDKTTEIDLPPGYRRAIISNLAVEISGPFGKTASSELITVASDSKRIIKRANGSPQNAMQTGLRSMVNRSRRLPSFQSGPFI